ncbi:hypothetical protein PVAP13_1KG212115 [Panicum virgatum]|uniref:Uncharacterized protein n=1 Tax=Panicum virgatum TaxID=38727 RepID=A0A8T0XH90_PANVG|nr:hypothetical protein PVAP13_1KG212115 [Panicum virgatum]
MGYLRMSSSAAATCLASGMRLAAAVAGQVAAGSRVSVWRAEGKGGMEQPTRAGKGGAALSTRGRGGGKCIHTKIRTDGVYQYACRGARCDIRRT